jgi:hypothetical protein
VINADLDSIKRELSKLTDVEYLKKEIAKLASEIRNYENNPKLPPQAKTRLKQLETHFKDLRVRLGALEKQAQSEITKIVAVLRKTKAQAEQKLQDAGLVKKAAARRKKKSSKKAAK